MASQDLKQLWPAWRQGKTVGGFSRSTIGADRSFPALVALLVLMHFWLAARLPAAADELYYWAWSKTPALSYYDHPPLVAWLIWVSTHLFGDTILGIRFFACVTSISVLLLLRHLAAGARLAVPFLFTPVFLYGGVLMTPDAPLMAFWTLYLAWLGIVMRRFSNWSEDPVSRVWRASPVPLLIWVLGGLCLGLGLLSKYTMALALPAAFLALRQYRFRAWAPGFLLHGAVAFVVASPILIFNLRHDFAPLAFQWRHALLGPSTPRFWEFVGTQILLVGALPFLMLPWVLAQNRELRANAELRAAYFLYLVPFAFFLYKATRSPLEANWPLVAYPAFVLVASALMRWSSFREWNRALTVIGFLLPLAVSAAFLVHMISPLPFVRPDRDRYHRMKAEETLAASVAGAARSLPLSSDSPLFATTYQWTAALRFQGLPVEQLLGAGRESEFTLRSSPICKRDTAFVFAQSGQDSPALSCFPQRTNLKNFALEVRGVGLVTFSLSRYDKYPPGAKDPSE